MFSVVAMFGQTRPNTFTEETDPDNSNFEVYSQKNGLPRRASMNNLKAFFDQYIYTSGDSICISRQAGDTCVYFVPTDIDSLGVSNDTLVIYGGGDEIADLPFSSIEAVIEIGSSNITDGDIATADIADGAVNSDKIADGSITNGDILDGTIATDDLADLVVTLAKIAANAIDSTKVIDGGLSGADLADAAILTAKIADSQVTGDKIASNTIPLGDLTEISSNTLLGRYSSGIGDVQQITIGSGLSFSGSTLTATGVAGNIVDSIRSEKVGQNITIFLYSGGSLVGSTTFTDSFEESIDDISISKVDSTVTISILSGGSTIASDSFIDSQGSGGSGVSALNDLSDVNITTPFDGTSLIYDSGSGLWTDGNPYPRYSKANEYTFVGGLVLNYATIASEKSSDAASYVKNTTGDFTFSIPDEYSWDYIRVEGNSSNLDGSGDLTIKLVSIDASDGSDNYITMPSLMANGQMISNWETYGGTVEYTFSNLGGFGLTGFVLIFEF